VKTTALCLLAAAVAGTSQASAGVLDAPPQDRAARLIGAFPNDGGWLHEYGAGAVDPQLVIRGQDTTYDTQPRSGRTEGALPGTYGIAPFGAPMFPGYDPFSAGMEGFPVSGYYDPFIDTFSYGLAGPVPNYRYVNIRLDSAYLFSEGIESTGTAVGEFQVTEVNTSAQFVLPLIQGGFFAWTPGVDVRFWEGPQAIHLPGEAYRIQSDFEFVTEAGPWALQLGFNPQLVTDFESSIGDDAFSWDGRGVLFYRAHPQLMLALGMAYWDRVTDRIIPYAGVVWNPDDRWEFRLLFPKSRVSVFLGENGAAAWWLYASGEYHVEAYQIDAALGRDRIELSDWRVLVGLRAESARVSAFVEGGWMFDRQMNFKGPNSDFSVADGFLVRAGLRF